MLVGMKHSSEEGAMSCETWTGLTSIESSWVFLKAVSADILGVRSPFIGSIPHLPHLLPLVLELSKRLVVVHILNSIVLALHEVVDEVSHAIDVNEIEKLQDDRIQEVVPLSVLHKHCDDRLKQIFSNLQQTPMHHQYWNPLYLYRLVCQLILQECLELLRHVDKPMFSHSTQDPELYITACPETKWQLCSWNKDDCRTYSFHRLHSIYLSSFDQVCSSKSTFPRANPFSHPFTKIQ